MAVRYSAEHLLFLRDSPLCVKPERLPPAEEWMGAPPSDHAREPRAQNKTVADRPRPIDNPLLEQANRRSGLSQHGTRNSTNPEDIFFAPPRMAFASSGRGNKTIENGRPKDADPQGRLNDRLRESRNTTLRRRGESDLDEGWSTVKPRKSFGADGAERFHGRMGGNFRDEKKPTKEKDDRDMARDVTRDRAARAFDGFTRDKDSGEGDGRPRNGLTRSKLDSPWYKHDSNDTVVPEKKERDRTKSWRDRDNAESADDRAAGRPTDRRWAREREREPRAERDPEWFDEPAEAARQSHTQQDFQKWMEQMKRAKGNGATTEVPATTAAAAVPEAAAEVEADKSMDKAMEKTTPVPSGLPAEAAPDKFFLAFGGAKTHLEPMSPSEQKEAAAKPKAAAAKSSRFTSFFNQPQEEARPRTEQPTSTVSLLPISAPGPAPVPVSAHAPPPEEERYAFQQLLAKLQKQSLSATPPAPSPFAVPPHPAAVESGKKSAYNSPDPFQQYAGERREGPIGRPPASHVQEILAPRPQQQSARPEQLLQDLVGYQQRVSSQGTGRPEQSRNNSNTEFLMNLMRSGPDSQHLLRMVQAQQPQLQTQPLPPQPLQQHQQAQQKPAQMPPPLNDRELDFSPRENRPQRQMRPQPPPGFPMDDSFHGMEQRDSRPGQPTQILQRPPLPGMDQMPPGWMAGGGQMPPPQQQRVSMLAPPGLPGGPNRNVPLPHLFPPNFPPPVGMPPPEAMGVGMPPRNIPLPPPGFFNGPPHGFMPPGLGGFNGPPGGPADAHVFGGSPFETRGIHPAGNGRGAAFGRP